MKNIIGIDLGTSNYCVAVFNNKRPVVIKNSEGSLTTPCVVSFTNASEYKVGIPAKRQAISNPQHTISSIKRLICESYNHTKTQWVNTPYRIIKSDNDITCVDIDGRLFTPQEIYSIMLTKAKNDAEVFLGKKVKKAIITVPVQFNYKQRQAIKEAGELAGLKIMRLISEPTTAALTYGFKNPELLASHDTHHIAMFHMGGGTCDISVIEMQNEVLEVKSTNGNNHLGGDDFDNAIVNWLAEEFTNENDVDIRKDPTALQRMKEAAEKAKIELSSSSETEINLPYIAYINGTPKHLTRILKRNEFEQMTEKLICNAISLCEKAITDANISVNDINDVVLIGGATRTPAIQEKVEEFFHKKPSMCVNPDEAVAIGAAIQGAILNGEISNMLVIDVTPFSLGLKTKDGIMATMIESNSPIPYQRKEVFSTAVDNQTSMEFDVLQGEHEAAHENISLGKFVLDGIPPMPKGVPQIEVFFDIDQNNNLTVTAKEKTSGKSNSMSFIIGEDTLLRWKQHTFASFR